MTNLHGIGVLVDGKAHGKRRGLFRKATGRMADVLGVYAADLADSLGRPFLDALLELVKTEGPLLDKFVIVEVLGYDDVEQTKGQGTVRAGTHLKMQASLRADPPR